MTDQLEPAERALFHELIAASQTLVTVTNNAATVLSEEFEDMVTNPAAAVAAVLERCPTPTIVWDGEFRVEDCDVEFFTPDVPDAMRAGRVNTGVRMRHRYTGFSTESYSAPEREVNEYRAARALRDRVLREARSLRPDPLQ